LNRHDATSEFLNYTTAKSAESTLTKVKSQLEDSEKSASKSIAEKLTDAEYGSFGQLHDDVARVGRNWIASLQSKDQEDSTTPARPSIEELKKINRIRSIETRIREVIEQEMQFATLRDGRKERMASASVANDTSAILTLFGNAPTPRQLFSSAQLNPSDSTIKSELPVEELNLPPGIIATKVIPGPAEETKKRTFGEAFAPPLALTALPLPKATKRPAARDNTIVWEFKDPVQRNKKGGYTVQSLSTSTWLSYGGEGAGVDSKSPRERRKLRDRALSGGEAITNGAPKVALLESLAKEEQALFARAYSSFAPSCDNSKALVSGETKGMVWWQSVGEQRYSNSTFALDPALEDISVGLVDGSPDDVVAIEERPEAFARIIEELEDYEQDLSNASPNKSKTNVDHILAEISELITTLASHRRIRNATLAPASTLPRAPIISPSPAVAAVSDPDVPSEAETETYHRLQRELAYLILRLPPYLVAKINGDQLAELGISGVIPFETRDIKGTMEEDQVFRQAKLAALSASTNNASTSARPGSSASQHYSTTAQHTPAIGQAANTRYGQQVNSRTPNAAAPQYTRTPSGGNQAYGTPTNARRLSGWQQQQPPPGSVRPGAGISNPNYANGQSQQQYYQQRPTHQTTPANYGGGYKSYQQQSSTPQHPSAPRPNSYAPQTQQYQSRPAQTPAGTTVINNPTASTTNYSASPAPPSSYNNANAASTAPRPGYAAPQTQQTTSSSTATNTLPQQQQPSSAASTNGVQQQQPSSLSATDVKPSLANGMASVSGASTPAPASAPPQAVMSPSKGGDR
jgi:hypothetical protein